MGSNPTRGTGLQIRFIATPFSVFLVIYNNNDIFNVFASEQRYVIILLEVHTYLNKKWKFDIVDNKVIALNIYDLGGVFYKAEHQGLL